MKIQFGRVMVLSLTILLLSYGTSSATLIESETSAIKGLNDTQGTADPIIRGPVIWVDAGAMHLASGGGDVDFFSIRLEEGEILMAATTPLAELFTMPDTILGLFDEDGYLLALNDDAGSNDPGDSEENLGSKIEYHVPEGATYYIGVTGYDDFDFDGYGYSDTNYNMQFNGDTPHDQSGAYMLTVTVIPEPATLSLLTLGLISFLRRRKLS